MNVTATISGSVYGGPTGSATSANALRKKTHPGGHLIAQAHANETTPFSGATFTDNDELFYNQQNAGGNAMASGTADNGESYVVNVVRKHGGVTQAVIAALPANSTGNAVAFELTTDDDTVSFEAA